MNLKSLALSVAACTQQWKYFAPPLASSLVHQTRGAIATCSRRIWKHLETVCGIPLNRTGGARAFYIHILPNKAFVCYSAVYESLASSYSYMRRRLPVKTHWVPDNWPTVERHPEVCTRGFSGDFSACERVSYKIDSLGFIFHPLLSFVVAESSWKDVVMFVPFLSGSCDARSPPGVQGGWKGPPSARGGRWWFPNRLKSQPASFLSFPASVIVCLEDKERQEWGKREQGWGKDFQVEVQSTQKGAWPKLAKLDWR